MSCHIIAATTAAAAAAELTTTLTLDTTQLPLPASCLSQLVEQHEADREKEREQQQKKQRERPSVVSARSFGPLSNNCRSYSS